MRTLTKEMARAEMEKYFTFEGEDAPLLHLSLHQNGRERALAVYLDDQLIARAEATSWAAVAAMYKAWGHNYHWKRPVRLG